MLFQKKKKKKKNFILLPNFKRKDIVTTIFWNMR